MTTFLVTSKVERFWMDGVVVRRDALRNRYLLIIGTRDYSDFKQIDSGVPYVRYDSAAGNLFPIYSIESYPFNLTLTCLFHSENSFLKRGGTRTKYYSIASTLPPNQSIYALNHPPPPATA